MNASIRQRILRPWKTFLLSDAAYAAISCQTSKPFVHLSVLFSFFSLYLIFFFSFFLLFSRAKSFHETICASKQLVGSHYFTLPLQRDLYQTEFLKKQREERDKSSLIQACRKYLLKTNSEESEICMGSNANIDENKDDENRSFNEILTEISKGLISKRTDNKKKRKKKR